MGLSAAQARLLTITARKSDCEFKSMGFSHEKIALSREMTDISNEYQNSLNLTKMVYDFYGNGDKSTPLSYNLLMTPSQLNGYMPKLTTDSSGKVVLDSKYAKAAAAAGIPKEGLNSLPSEDVRNKFLMQLAEVGYITTEEAESYCKVQYSPDMGLGTTDLVTTNTKDVGWDEFLQMFDDINFSFDMSGSEFAGEDAESSMVVNGTDKGNLHNWAESNKNTITMEELLTGNYSIFGGDKDHDGNYADFKNLATNISKIGAWEDMFAAFRQVLGGSSINNQALDYAEAKIRSMLYFEGIDYTTYDGNIMTGSMELPDSIDDSMIACDDWGFYMSHQKSRKRAKYHNVADRLRPELDKYIGYVGMDYIRQGERDQYDGVGISISNIARAFLTYFVQFIDGFDSPYKMTHDQGLDARAPRNRKEEYTITGEERSIFNNNLIDPTKAKDYKFTVTTDTGINTNQALMSGFYDALFNQICLRGWVENDNINDNNYLQETYKNGMLFLTTCAEDGFYYQENCGTNTYIKEVADDEAIARAEAKYNTQKQKLNQKEEIIDMKMKNLDTEISSLTTEYDTVKSLITKNIERGFKRYDA